MSSSSKEVSIVSIECALGIDPPRLYCPRTGNLVLQAGEDVEQPASPYVTFVYHNECDFIFLREDLEQRLEEARAAIAAADPDEYDDADDVPRDLDTLLEHVFLGEVPLVYEVSSRYMGNGPVTETVHVGFDLWPVEEQEGEGGDEEDGDDENSDDE